MTYPRPPADRERFAALLIAGHSLSEAAAAVGISQNTASRWRTSPEVETALDEHRREVRAHVSHRLAAFVQTALERSESLLADPDTPPQVIARLLGLALAESRLWVDVEEVLRRVERLEARTAPTSSAEQRENLLDLLGIESTDPYEPAEVTP